MSVKKIAQIDHATGQEKTRVYLIRAKGIGSGLMIGFAELAR